MSAADKIVVRIQTPEGIKRVEASPKTSIFEFNELVRGSLKIDGRFSLFMERNFISELAPTPSETLYSKGIKHGDIIFLKQYKKSPNATVSTGEENRQTPIFTGNLNALFNIKSDPEPTEDEVDMVLSNMDGRIERGRDPKLCRHNSNGCCVHCSPIEPYDDAYLKEQNIKHLSFHSYLRKQTSGIDRGKYVVFEDINCRIKAGCREHQPWPKGVCSRCQPSAITLNRQTYRHVDNVMFENTSIVERFLNYWRTTGHQRVGFLYGSYEVNSDVPLGIRAKVAAIYEPPQESTRDSIELFNNNEMNDVDEVAKAFNLKRIGWIFTDLITDDPGAGTVKQIRGIETHFLTAQECIMAGHFQNCHPNSCKYSSSGVFGSKFVTVCVTGGKTKQVHMDGYAVSAQCMALVRDNCLVPTKKTPELGYIRESTDKQYVPDVYYKETDKYGNEVQRLARPLPVEYLLVDIPASTPLLPQYTFTQCLNRKPFPIENRYIDGHLQDFIALSAYFSQWKEDEFIEAMSDFHLLIFLYKLDMVPLKSNMGVLFDAIRTKNTLLANEFKKNEAWTLVESLITLGTNEAPGRTSVNYRPFESDDENIDDESTWTCHHCTFINQEEHNSCEICGLPKYMS